MSIINEIKHAREALRFKDRQKAIEALAKRLHYKVAPCVKAGDRFELFADENDMIKFYKENELHEQTFRDLMKELVTEGLMNGYELNECGVYKLCKES